MANLGIKSIIIVILIVFSQAGLAENKVILGNFSEHNANIPAAWEVLTFGSIDEYTSYSVVVDKGMPVIKARSIGSASGLIRKLRYNPKEYPYLSWRWKVNQDIAGTDVTSKSGDDYAARIYVMFEYKLEDLPEDEQSRVKWYRFFNGKLPPLATLNYIWANKMPVGKIVSSAYTKRVKMIAVKNTTAKLQQWYTEERNIYEDYKNAFGEEPKDVISIAIMTDTDNTGSEAESFYGNIIISKKPLSEKILKKVQLNISRQELNKQD